MKKEPVFVAITTPPEVLNFKVSAIANSLEGLGPDNDGDGEGQ
jgi:hypothetical protein